MSYLLKITIRAFLFIAFGIVSATAAEVVIENTSSDNARLYSSHGHGWEYEGTIRAGSRAQYHQSDSGHKWGFSDPHSNRIDIIKQITVKSRGGNYLTLTERDLGHGGGPLPILRRTVTITNFSSEPVGVFVNHGRGWHHEDTLRAGENEKYNVDNGDEWGIDNPFKGGTNIIKHLTIKSWDPLPALSINNAELGIQQHQQKNITVVNNSGESLKVYLRDDRRHSYKYVDTIRAHSSDQFKTHVGDDWCFDDPHRSGVNPIKQLTIKAFGGTRLTADDRDVHHNHGGGGGVVQPRKVSIRFKNQSIHKANISRKNGPFSKTYLNTVGPWGSKTFSLTPGETIVINRPGEVRGLKYRVPNSSQTFPFKP